MSETQTTYNDKVVKQFTVMAVIWGIVGMLVGVIITISLARTKLWSLATFWSPPSAAYKRSYFCLWWISFVCYIILGSPKNVSYALMGRSVNSIYFLGLAISNCFSSYNSSIRLYHGKRICRIRMAN